MPRARRKTGDDATNARKRYYRSAERYLKRAEQATGATAARYRQLARQDLDNALNTYSKSTTQKFSKPIQRLANDLGVSLDQERQKIKARSDEYAEKTRKAAIDLGPGSASAKRLAGSMDDAEALRQGEARAIINSPIGHRILGGLVDVWREQATIEDESGKLTVDQSKILPILFDYFNVDNLADMLKKVEEIVGDKLYADEDDDMMYEAVRIMLQTHVATDNSVTE